MLIFGYVNLYRCGFFHRCGKPGTVDRHAGDVYTSKSAAMAAIDPRAEYIETILVLWNEAVEPATNPEDSQPVPLKRGPLALEPKAPEDRPFSVERLFEQDESDDFVSPVPGLIVSRVEMGYWNRTGELMR